MKLNLSVNLRISPLFTNLLILPVLILYFFFPDHACKTRVRSSSADSLQTTSLSDPLLRITFSEQVLEVFNMHFSQLRRRRDQPRGQVGKGSVRIRQAIAPAVFMNNLDHFDRIHLTKL